MTQGGEETDEHFLEALKRQEFIVSGQEIWDFLRKNHCLQNIDWDDCPTMEAEFITWLKTRDMASESDTLDTGCPDCDCKFSIPLSNNYVRL